MSKRWNYLTVEVKAGMLGIVKPQDIQDALTRHGALGWELVNLVFAPPINTPMLIFKKEE
ncbi:DUF4177 domain-containing protein [Stenotrophomonas sp. TWI700]|uniref:DUF4177 domain-containing protein n=1 Tax=Stenotrophomonas sp. TWI700 TaxID=3136792 RepID=UPI00320B3098